MKEEAIIEYLNKGVGFVEGQAPLVVNEILTYDWYYYIAVIVIQILISLLCGLGALMILTRKNLDLSNDDVVAALAMVGFSSLTLCVLLWPAILINSFSLFKICVAPRLYLIERLSEFI